MRKNKLRLDLLLVDRNFVSSRQEAKSYILAGKVLVDRVAITKAGFLVSRDADILLRFVKRYVSRGGIKLEKALDCFDICVDRLVIVDIGSSSGGFTDCVLKKGASKVYCVDVGRNQLDYSLRIDPRVVVMEGTHVRDIRKCMFSSPDMVLMDLSFISLTKVLHFIFHAIGRKKILLLVKPQFEVARDIVNFKGVVRGFRFHRKALIDVYECLFALGFNVIGLTYSPITGPKGNIEFFIYCDSSFSGRFDFYSLLDDVIMEAYNALL